MQTDSKALNCDTPCAKSLIVRSRQTPFSTSLRNSSADRLPKDATAAISSPSSSNTNNCGRLTQSWSQNLTKSVTTGALETRMRPGSSDELMANLSSSIPGDSVSNARLFYRQWRTRPQREIGAYNDSDTKSDDKTKIDPTFTFCDLFGLCDTEVSLALASNTLEESDVHLPQIMEKSELTMQKHGNSAMYNQLESRVDFWTEPSKSQKDVCNDKRVVLPKNDINRCIHPVGSYEQQHACSDSTILNMTRSSSYQALSDYEKQNYFPTPPKVRNVLSI